MKKKGMFLFCFSMVVFVLSGCSSMNQKVTETPLNFNSQAVNADNYSAKIKNVVVIMDASNSMNEACVNGQKFAVEKEFLTAMNNTVPELGYASELVSFGKNNYFSGAASLSQYSTASFATALQKVNNPSGNTSKPMGKAITAAGNDLLKTQGKCAVIIVSDGERLYSAPLAAVKALNEKLGSRVCVYTVQIGNDPQGATALQELSSAGVCGKSVAAADLTSAAAMQDFVKTVYCAEKPRPIVKPVPVPAPAPVVQAPLDSDGDGVIDSKDACPNTPAGASVNAQGCWAYSAGVLFPINGSTINARDNDMLNNGAKIMLNNPQLKVEFSGHTDNTGSEAYNLQLSKKRALAVVNYFIAQGVNAERMTATGYGFSKPVASNSTAKGRAQNRRVDLKILQ